MAKRNVLIVVDMQNDFVDGALGTQEAVAIVPAVVARIEKARAEGDIIIATQDTHQADYAETREGRFLPVPHCIEGTPGWQLQPDVQRALGANCTLVKKPTFGCAELPALVERLAGDVGENGAGLRIELLGLCTDICVVSNALLLKAAFREADMAVNAACCAGVTPQKHAAALETMASCQVEVL